MMVAAALFVTSFFFLTEHTERIKLYQNCMIRLIFIGIGMDKVFIQCMININCFSLEMLVFVYLIDKTINSVLMFKYQVKLDFLSN